MEWIHVSERRQAVLDKKRDRIVVVREGGRPWEEQGQNDKEQEFGESVVR